MPSSTAVLRSPAFREVYSPAVLLVGAVWALVLAFKSSARLLRERGAPDD